MVRKKQIALLVIVIQCFCMNVNARDDLKRWKSALENPGIDDGAKIWYADSALLYYRKINADSAMHYAKLLLHHATLAQDTGSVDYANMYMGSLHRKLGSYDSSLFYYNKALVSYRQRNYEEGIASVYNNVATVYTTQNRYDLAIQNYHEALAVFSQSENLNAKANIYSNFASLYYKLENYDKAWEYWKIARTTYPQSEVAYEVTNSIRGMARIYIERGELDSARTEVNNALLLDRANDVPVFIVEDLLLRMELANRIAWSLELEVIGDSVRKMLPVVDLPGAWARYYELRGDQPELFRIDADRSIRYYDSSLAYLDAAEVPEDRLRVLKSKFMMNLTCGMLFDVLQDYREIVALGDIVAALRRDRITQEMDASYNLRENEKMIAVLHEKNRATEELVQKEKQQNLFLGIGIIAICLFVIYGIFIYRRLRSTKGELEKSVHQKDFLFKELNHRVKNNLAIVNSFLGIEMHGRPEEVQQILRDCENRIHSLGLMHEMLYKSEADGQIELKSYFEKLVDYISKSLADNRAEISIEVNEPVWMSSDKIVLLGLIVNELLTNAMKYAKDPSRNLKITLGVVKNAGQVLIAVSDNGVGLSADFNPATSNSLGMKLANGLTKQLKGKFMVKNPGQGSSFEIILET